MGALDERKPLPMPLALAALVRLRRRGRRPISQSALQRELLKLSHHRVGLYLNHLGIALRDMEAQGFASSVVTEAHGSTTMWSITPAGRDAVRRELAIIDALVHA